MTNGRNDYNNKDLIAVFVINRGTKVDLFLRIIEIDVFLLKEINKNMEICPRSQC